MKKKIPTATTPEERVLCAYCGEPVKYRRVLVFDCPVTPEGEPQYEHEAENDYDSQQDNGLYCAGCGDFLTDDYGYNADHDEIPKLLTEGRLKLAKPTAKKKLLKK